MAKRRDGKNPRPLDAARAAVVRHLAEALRAAVEEGLTLDDDDDDSGKTPK